MDIEDYGSVDDTDYGAMSVAPSSAKGNINTWSNSVGDAPGVVPFSRRPANLLSGDRVDWLASRTPSTSTGYNQALGNRTAKLLIDSVSPMASNSPRGTGSPLWACTATKLVQVSTTTVCVRVCVCVCARACV